ncbi:class F sortase [Blastococcus goldschmidtiae]|uniref:Class F sortase n=1 Tax=Blastococcus goldschmidtiae TaxID=3075546 RepID=A0ABU2K719_9ACTN|nr:class F sortase [Blastococcus sp. DSM 46792]MDT0275971.1 class F sortase [Blastococcus sp. DSM 46792]
MVKQQGERFRRRWSSAFLFATAVVLAVAGVLLLLPAHTPDASVGTSPPPVTAPLAEEGGRPSASDARAGTSLLERTGPIADAPPRGVPSGQPVGVRVDAIDVDARVVPLGLDADGQLEVPEDFSAAGWWEGGAEAGEPGPTVVVGHVDSYEGPAVFHRLRDLEVGDEIALTVEGGESVSYRVTGMQEVPKDEFPTEAVYGTTPGPTLRLITCGGPFDRTARSYLDNTIVFADLS